MPNQTDEANLLIVDDLPENLLALEALLQGPGIRVHQADPAYHSACWSALHFRGLNNAGA